MIRFFKRLIYLLLFSMATAAGLVLWLSPDPLYTVQEWTGGSRYWQYDALIHDIAQKHGVNPVLLKAIVWRESAFHPDKVGTSGERGLMQVGEAAADDWAKASKIETFVPTDLFDAKTNLDAGTWYLRRALERWKDKADPVPFALAEYNAGKTRVDRWIAETNLGAKADAHDLQSAIDFPTTRKYIEEIQRRQRFYEERGRL
jgi:soluble lytic murein transglycosylase